MNTRSACKHFQQQIDSFNKNSKFTLIGHLTSTSKSKKTLAQRLIVREMFLIFKLDILYLKFQHGT